MKNALTLVLLFVIKIGYTQTLTIVEQDFEKAKKIALAQNKLLFIDFYTSWCIPCKELDEWALKNDTVSQKFATNFVVLRYNAEDDKVFNLSVKHHVNSYPTAIILTTDGYILNRKYGFSGENAKDLTQSVLEFAKESITLNEQNKTFKGYSNTIHIDGYPQFYIDYVNREDLKVVGRSDFKSYWRNAENVLSEEYFSTLFYFAMDVPSNVAERFLTNKNEYMALYGEGDVKIALTLLTYGRFNEAIKSKSDEKFNEAVEFMKKAVSEESTEKMLLMFTKRFEEAKNN